jgi:hypothetical protein
MSDENIVHTEPQPWLDMMTEKIISRKLIVFLVGTGFFAAGFGLTSEDWMTLAVAYVGSQGFIDAIVAFRKSR